MKGFEVRTPTFKYCVCTKCVYYEDKDAGKPCQEIKCKECGAPLKGSNEIPTKLEEGDDPAGGYLVPEGEEQKELEVLSMGPFASSKEGKQKPILCVYSTEDTLTEEDVDMIQEVVLSKLPEGSKLIVLCGGDTLSYFGADEEFELLPIEEKVGAVLNKGNKDKLGKAITLVEEVLASAEKEDPSDKTGGGIDDDKKLVITVKDVDASIIKIVEDKKEPEPQKEIDLPVSKEEISNMVRGAIKESLGKLD